jgi:hypothetical protein
VGSVDKPPPAALWSVEEQSACFIVCDHNGQALAYVYFEDEPGREQHPTLTRGDGTHCGGTVDCDHRRVAMLRLAFLEAVDCHKRRPHQGSARYHHDKRYCS